MRSSDRHTRHSEAATSAAGLARRASSAAHDLRNIMTVLAAHGDALQRAATLDPELRGSIERIRLTTERLGELATGLSLAAEQAVPGSGRPLPAPAEPPTQTSRLPSHEDGARQPLATILLAEPQQQVREVAAAALTAQGYAVLQAHDGQSALEQLDDPEQPIELAVVDAELALPNEELLIDNLVHPSGTRGGELPLVLMVRESSPAIEPRAHPRSQLLSRPFPLSALSEAVNRLLGNHRRGSSSPSPSCGQTSP